MSSVTMSQDVYYDPYDVDLCLDPYPAFRRLRDEAPLYYNERYDFYAVSRFADVEAALVDHATFSSGRGVILEMIQANIDMPVGTLIHDEGRTHTIHRSLLSRVFTPKSMLAIEPQVREFCAARLDELVGRDGFDVVHDYAEYIPMRVFGMLLGIPDDEQEAMRLNVEEGMHAEPGKPKEYDVDNMTGDYYVSYVEDRYANPRDDLITKLLFTEFDDTEGNHRTLTRQEALTYLGVIAGAGNHTTNRLIGWTAKVLADNPDARREVVADRSLIPSVIEETLRYEPSSTQIARSLSRDVELYGQTVPAGSAIMLLRGSANRDHRAFPPDGDLYDIHRNIGHHLAFGYGIHFCLGAALARMEAQVALDEVLTRFPDWEVDAENAELDSSIVRGWKTLPVSLG